MPRKPIIFQPEDKHHRLTVIEFDSIKKGSRVYRFRCDCGRETKAAAYSVLRGAIRSCGCLKAESNRRRAPDVTTHGLTNSPTYRSWLSMKRRCSGRAPEHRKCYAGRGIRVCDRWASSFENFVSDMGLRPSLKFTLERKDTNGDYCLENCRWATPKEQGNNRRTNVMVCIAGETMTATQACERFGVVRSLSSFLRRIHRGQNPEAALAVYRGK